MPVNDTISRTARSFLQVALGALVVAGAAIPVLHLAATQAAAIGAVIALVTASISFTQNLLEELGKIPSLLKESPTDMVASVALAVESALRDSGLTPAQLASDLAAALAAIGGLPKAAPVAPPASPTLPTNTN